jgi:hypothetical protein
VNSILVAVKASMSLANVAPALMRLHLVTLHTLQMQHRAFALPTMRSQVLPELLQLILQLQLQRHAALLGDELQAGLWELLQAAEEPEQAALQSVQNVLAGMHWLQAEHLAELDTAAAAGMTAIRRCDAPGFASAIAEICNDLRVWSASSPAAQAGP